MILILDNHDSYTYNIFQVLRAGTAREVRVIPSERADEACGLIERGEVAGVVISPGPGHPANADDFEGSAAVLDAVLARPQLPLLAVCLGHQGLAMRFGWRVVPAPEPRHGVRSPLAHTGDGLFEGLPQGMLVTRYHSLAIEGHGVPVADASSPGGLVARVIGGLRITAQSEDGVIQAFEVPHRPWHAVQFHPESIASEHGTALLMAFLGIVDERAAAPRGAAPRSPEPPAPARGPGGRGRSVRFLASERRPADPEALVLALGEFLRDRPGFFLVDAPDDDGERARWTVLGDASDPACAAAPRDAHVLRFRPGQLAIDRYAPGARGFERETEREGCRDPWAELADRQRVQLMPADAASARELADDALIFRGGHVGVLSYELGVRSLGVRPPASPFPDAVWIRPARWFVLDRELGCVTACGLAPAAAEALRLREAARCELDRAFAAAAARETATAGPGDAGAAGTGMAGAEPGDAGTAGAEVPGAGVAGAGAAGDDAPLVAGRWRVGAERYAQQIAECKIALSLGESYELCLTTAFEVSRAVQLDAWHLHRELRRSERAPYAAVLRVEDESGPLELVGASPERFVRGAGRVWESKPIKGTAPRDPDPARDRLQAAQLGRDRKSYAENLLIVDLVRNDLGMACEPGSVEVPALMAVESFATVHQLVSTIRGVVRPELEPVDVVRALFPGGSMTGAPKERSVRILCEIEGRARGVYSGTLGLLGFDGRTELGMVIRTAVHAEGRWTIGAGGAIVMDSDPAAEIDEVVLKASGMRRAMARAAARADGAA